jgi:hypothetical protein
VTVVTATGIYAVNKLVPKKWIRVLLYVVILGTVNWGVLPFVDLVPDFPMNPAVLSLLSKLGGVVFSGVLLAIAKDRFYLALWSVLMAAALGNGLSNVLPPFATIDFIYSRTLYDWLGLGVFNVADFLTDLFLVGLTLYSLFKLVTLGWRKKVPKNASPTEEAPTPPKA